MIDTGRAVLRTAQNIDELKEFMEILIDLHKRRFFINGRQTSKNTDHFWNFHREVARRLLLSGHVQLHLLEIDGIPAAAEYHFSGGGTPYAYQAGIDPELITSIGNAASTGASMVLLSRDCWAKANELNDCIEHIELSSRLDFNEYFVENMDFPQENLVRDYDKVFWDAPVS